MTGTMKAAQAKMVTRGDTHRRGSERVARLVADRRPDASACRVPDIDDRRARALSRALRRFDYHGACVDQDLAYGGFVGLLPAVGDAWGTRLYVSVSASATTTLVTCAREEEGVLVVRHQALSGGGLSERMIATAQGCEQLFLCMDPESVRAVDETTVAAWFGLSDSTVRASVSSAPGGAWILDGDTASQSVVALMSRVEARTMGSEARSRAQQAVVEAARLRIVGLRVAVHAEPDEGCVAGGPSSSNRRTLWGTLSEHVRPLSRLYLAACRA